MSLREGGVFSVVSCHEIIGIILGKLLTGFVCTREFTFKRVDITRVSLVNFNFFKNSRVLILQSSLMKHYTLFQTLNKQYNQL